MSFDFAKAQVRDTVRTLVVLHPSTGEKVAEIDLYSSDADRPLSVRRMQEKMRLKSRNPMKLDIDQIRSDALDVLAACTVAWRGVEWDGVEMECTPANAKKLYEAIPWLRGEVDKFVDEVSNFLET